MMQQRPARKRKAGQGGHGKATAATDFTDLH